MCNDIFPAIIEKQKILEANERHSINFWNYLIKKMMVNQNHVVVLKNLT